MLLQSFVAESLHRQIEEEHRRRRSRGIRQRIQRK